MKGKILNFRRARHHTYENQMIVNAGCKSREDAQKLVGKKVSWKSTANREIVGEVRSAHGNKGAVRVLFEKGMPGQAIGSEVQL